jgi:hypothetical protein
MVKFKYKHLLITGELKMNKVITKTLIAGAISTAMLAGAVQADVTMVSWGGGY